MAGDQHPTLPPSPPVVLDLGAAEGVLPPPPGVEVEPWVHAALAGAVYPLTRAHLLLIARENGLEQRRLTLLHVLPERVFTSEDEVGAALLAAWLAPP